jgi:deoxyribonuclease V
VPRQRAGTIQLEDNALRSMKLYREHSWDLSPKEAIGLQNHLKDEVILEDRLGPVRLVAGIDVGFEQSNTVTRAAVAVLDYPSLEQHEQSVARQSFREIPAVLDALDKLSRLPDLILCDGQGYAHPRRFGIACHLGVITDLPSIGVAKTRLIGTHDDVPQEKGAWRPLIDKDEVIGAVLRTRTGVRPLFISCGHRVSLDTAIQYVLACTTRYRLPETTRWAHRLASG